MLPRDESAPEKRASAEEVDSNDQVSPSEPSPNDVGQSKADPGKDDSNSADSDKPANRLLPREEYVEQSYLFKALCERLSPEEPVQKLLAGLREEVLVTTKLPLAIDFLLSEVNHMGTMASAMQRMLHYFTHFQTFLISEAEQDVGRFDIVTAFNVLYHEATLRVENTGPVAMFLYQFETICRNRLDYYKGLRAMAYDPVFDERWRQWIRKAQNQIEAIGLADLIYVHSEFYVEQQRRRYSDGFERPENILFGEREGKIALANRKKEPSYLFSALQRQLNYPKAPRRKIRSDTADAIPKMMRQIERLEVRLKLMEEEHRSGAVDLSRFMKPGGLPKSSD